MLGVSVITFFLAQVVPVDPALVALGQNAREDQINAYRHEMGLDRPVVVQYFSYVGHLVQGDLGKSIRTRRADGMSTSHKSQFVRLRTSWDQIRAATPHAVK